MHSGFRKLLIILFLPTLFWPGTLNAASGKPEKVSVAVNKVKSKEGHAQLSSKKLVGGEEDEEYLAKAEYPKFTGPKESSEQISRLNLAVEEYVHRLYARKGNRLVRRGPAATTDWDLDTGVKTTVTIEYSIDRADSAFVSIVFTREIYSEQRVHGSWDVYGFNYDVQRKRLVRLGDLFELGSNYIKEISAYCDRDLIRQLEGLWGEGGIKKDDLEQFTFDHKKLIIHFSSYQVASYPFGMPEVEIPFEKLKGLKKGL